MVGYVDDKDDVLKRLRRIEGQVRGLQRMVEPRRTASTSSRRSRRPPGRCESVALALLEDHLSHCVADGDRRGW